MSQSSVASQPSSAVVPGVYSSANASEVQEEEEETEEVDFKLVCKIDNARIISNILSALQISSKKEGQQATVTLSKSGIKFTVEESKSFQGTAFLQKELFQEFLLKIRDEDPPLLFKINFSVFMDCISIYGSANSFVALQMAYGGYGETLAIMLEENGVITSCGLRTLEPEELQLLAFRSTAIPNKVIMEAEYLRDAFNELDWSSTDVTVLMSPDEPHFRLSTTGPSGSCQVDYPKDSDVFETFECDDTAEFTYKLAHMQPAVKALSLSHKTQLRINQMGILSLQHMIKNDGNNYSFVDFFIVPKREEEDEEGDD